MADSKVTIRVATLEDREALEKWCNGTTSPQIAKEFPFIWRRNQSWEPHPPTIALFEGQVIGFHGTAYTKTGYANLYYVAVDNEFKGCGLGKKLIENSLKRAHALGMKRWTNKSHVASDGENFFSHHLHLIPLARKGEGEKAEVVYDWSLEGITTCADIQAAADAGTIYRMNEIPPRKLGAYQKALRTDSTFTLLQAVPNLVSGQPSAQELQAILDTPPGTYEVETQEDGSIAAVPAGTAQDSHPPVQSLPEALEAVNKAEKIRKPRPEAKPTKNCKPEIPVDYTGQSQRKLVVVLIGGSCSGKTTLRRLFTQQDVGTEKHSFMKSVFWALQYQCCGQRFDKKEFLAEHMKMAGEHKPLKGVMAPYEVKYTLFSNGTAICGYNGARKGPDGNLVAGTGADSNGNTEANICAIDHCIMERNLIIYDGVMMSEKLLLHLQNHCYSNLTFLFVHLDVSEEGVLQRLAVRRANNGQAPADVDKQNGVLSYRKTAIKNWKKAGELFTREPSKFIVIPEGPTPEEIFEQLKREVAALV